MVRISWLWLAAMAWTLVACGGGREENLSCDDVSQCRTGSICLNGFCQEVNSLSAIGDSAGASTQVPVLIIDGSGNTCEAASCTNLPFGSPVTFRAGSAPGYRFTGWTGTGECTGNSVDLVIPELKENTHCTANYVRRVKVAAHTSDAEGGVTVSSSSPFAICTDGVCEVDAGQPVTLRADDRFGQRFTGWSGEGCGSATSFETTVVASGDLLCVANFVQRIMVSGTAMNASTTIEVSSDGAVCEAGSCILDKGGNATLLAPAVPKFRFAGWSGSSGCVGSDPTLRFSALQQSESCLATYTPRVTVHGSTSGAEPPPAITALSSDLYASCDGPGCETDVGGGVTLLASSASGFRLAGWSGPACEAQRGAAVMLSEVTSDTECVANYLQGIAVIGAVVGAPGQAVASSSSPTAVCAEGGCVIDIGSDATLAAPAPAGYRFLGWDGDEGCTSMEASVSFAAVTASKTCYARFAARYLVRGTASPNDGGTVAASSSSAGAQCAAEGCTLDGGGEVSLTATPRDGFRFSGWSGGGGCTGTDTTVRVPGVQGNTTCQANFVGRFTVAGIAAPIGGGSVVASSDSGAASCAGATCELDRGSRISLTATAAEGFRFVAWTGCPGATGSTLTVENIAQDMTCTATFTPLRYTVSSSVAPADSGSVQAAASAGSPQCGNGQCSIDWDSAVTLTAAPATGWQFAGWTGCTTSDQPSITLPNVRADTTCQARFQRITFQVTGAFAPDNGGRLAISASGPSASCTGLRCTVPYGGGATLTATPAAGWSFGGWSGCSTSMTPTLELASITGNADCTANFTRQRFDVVSTLNPAAGGTVTATSAAQGAACSAGRCTVNYGSDVSLGAAASTGWAFSNWSGCSNSTNPQLTVANVTAATSCQANFARMRFTVTGNAGTGGAVVASASGGDCADNRCTVDYGSTVALMAVPMAGFEFMGWASCPATGGAAIQLPAVTADVSCSAAFQRLSFPVAAAPTPAEGGAVSVAAMSDAQCSGASCVVFYGGSVTFAAAPAVGYDLTGWGGGCTALASDPTRAVVGNVTAPASCAASFTLRSYRVTGAAAAGGTISAASATRGSCSGAVCTVSYGGSATFTAAPDAGYFFTGWTGCAANPQNPLQATVGDVTAAATCSAGFQRLRYTVSGTAGPGGAVAAASAGGDCNGNSCAVDYGTTVTLMAMPLPGYQFTGWTACPVTGGAAIQIANVMSNVSCTAAFERLHFAVTGSASPSNGGSVSVDSVVDAQCTGNACDVLYGGSVTYAAVLADGFDLSSWTGGCKALASDPTRAVVSNVTAGSSCVANFARRSYTVTGTAGAGGRIAQASTTSGVCSGAVCTVSFGASATFTAALDAGFSGPFWQGCTADPANPLQATIANITAAATCSASFQRLRYTVAGAADVGGVVAAAADGGDCSGSSCSVDYGSTVTLMAMPLDGYQFAGWTGCPVTGGAAIQLANVMGNVTCTANFTRRSFTVTGAAAPTTAGGVRVFDSTSATCTGLSCSVLSGGGVTFEAAPNDGFSVRWTGCTPLPDQPLRAQVANVAADAACVANFSRVSLTVSGVTGTGGNVTQPSANPGSCAGNVCTVEYGGTVTFTAQPDTAKGYVFAGWSGACVVGPADPLVGIAAGVTASGTCTANFRLQTWTVTGGVSGPGRFVAAAPNTTCTGGACTVLDGTVVTLTAVEAGSRFTGWACSDQTTSQELVLSVTARGDVTCTASFVSRRTITVTSESEKAFTVSLEGGGAPLCTSTTSCAVDLGSTITLVAENVDPNSFFFGGWVPATQADSCPVADATKATTTLVADGTYNCLAKYDVILK